MSELLPTLNQDFFGANELRNIEKTLEEIDFLNHEYKHVLLLKIFDRAKQNIEIANNTSSEDIASRQFNIEMAKCWIEAYAEQREAILSGSPSNLAKIDDLLSIEIEASGLETIEMTASQNNEIPLEPKFKKGDLVWYSYLPDPYYRMTEKEVTGYEEATVKSCKIDQNNEIFYGLEMSQNIGYEPQLSEQELLDMQKTVEYILSDKQTQKQKIVRQVWSRITYFLASKQYENEISRYPHEKGKTEKRSVFARAIGMFAAGLNISR